MANIFLDANVLIDIYDRNSLKPDFILGNSVFVSPLSVHLLCYFAKTKVPNPELLTEISQLNIVDFTEEIMTRSFLGPTSDFEDNVQLHSCASCSADAFYTSDTGLLKLGYFGFTRILPTGDIGNLDRLQ